MTNLPPYPFEEVKMTDRQREAFRLACRGLDHIQIAKVMGIKWRAVYNNLSAALAKIEKATGKKLSIKDLPHLFIQNLLNERN